MRWRAERNDQRDAVVVNDNFFNHKNGSKAVFMVHCFEVDARKDMLKRNKIIATVPATLTLVSAAAMVTVSAVALVTVWGALVFMAVFHLAVEPQPMLQGGGAGFEHIVVGELPAGSTWKMWEITLLANTDYNNPFKDVTISATFSNPAGDVMNVKGFWDGERTYRVRFTPPDASAWSYQISSNHADLALELSTVEMKFSSATGFLRRDAELEYAYGFVYDNGQHFFMFGQTFYEIVSTAVSGEKMDNGQEIWQYGIDQTAAHGMNKVRLLVSSWDANGFTFSFPYRHTTDNPPEIISQNEIDLHHWQNLDRIVQYIAEKGLIADIVIFNDDQRAYGTEAQDQRLAA